MTEIELLIDFHKDAPRQGPGSTADTLKALAFMEVASRKGLKVADIGCGSGAQTIVLAQNLDAKITAIDLFPEFLDKLRVQSMKLGLQEKIVCVQKSMHELAFGKEELDIIWSEGAIYNMGFEHGVCEWKEFLKPGGYMALSEITWLTHSRPKEIELHWSTEYPEIDTASHIMCILEKNGFSPIAYFVFPESCWIENYYLPMEKRFDVFLERHHYHEMAIKIVQAEKDEIRKYKEYKDYFGYGFYIARKIG